MKKQILFLFIFIYLFGFFTSIHSVKAQVPICSSFTMTLKMGMNNTEVKCLQQTLNNNGFKISSVGVGSPGFETTYFGNLTDSAVKAFQLTKGLVADGIFGFLSRTALGNSIGVFPLGCTSSVGYSTLTGALCNGAVTFPLGCTSSIGYSPLTGLKCDGSVSNIFPLGCTSNIGYSIITGMLCSGNISSGGSGSSGGGGGGSSGGSTSGDSEEIIIPPSPPPIITIIGNSATGSFKFGMNSVFNFDPVIKKIIADPSQYSLYTPLFSKYHIDHLRYPGGIPTRYYFWDNVNLVKNATDAIAQYYYAQGTASGVVQGDTYSNFNFTIDPNNYTQFLNFVKTAGIKPIIQMNTLFYIDNGVIYQTESFQKNFDAFPLEADRWTKIATYLNAQMDYTHSIFPEPLIWELGNEDNAIFDASEYGLIVSNYTDIIKARYPNDKVIVAMSGGEMKTARKAQWNKDFVAYLDTNGALPKIDYFAPHYYIGTTFVSQIQNDINERIKSTDFTTFFNDMKSNFPVGYTPKFSITEFSELLHSDDNVNYNTQLDAMLMWDELLKFHSEPNIVSVTKLGFTADKNALFFDKTISNNFSYVDQFRQDSDTFAYIPPQTDAVKIFFDAIGEETIIEFLINDNYELLVTQTGNTKYLQVLNYNDTPQTIDISQYGEGTFTTYTLPALTTYYWDAEANKTTGNTTSTMTLPVHSFTTIIIQ